MDKAYVLNLVKSVKKEMPEGFQLSNEYLDVLKHEYGENESIDDVVQNSYWFGFANGLIAASKYLEVCKDLLDDFVDDRLN